MLHYCSWRRLNTLEIITHYNEVYMKKFLIIFLSFLLLSSFNSFAQRKSSGFKSYNKSKSTYSYKTPKIKSKSSSILPRSKSTYKYKSPSYNIAGTKYKYGETYKSSGLPKVERSSTAKREFLKSNGYSKTPKGYEVDHIVPLSKGGKDVPSNMQLLPKEVHKQKTTSERKNK